MDVFWMIEPGPPGTTFLVIYRADKRTREVKDQKRLTFTKRLTKEEALQFVHANYQRGLTNG